MREASSYICCMAHYTRESADGVVCSKKTKRKVKLTACALHSTDSLLYTDTHANYVVNSYVVEVLTRRTSEHPLD